jgi:putative MFS transporter
MTDIKINKQIKLAILVSALGYFVDVYDLLLFSIVRIDSLKALGLKEEELLSAGVKLLNAQMLGMLVGGVLWGVLGDKKGRIQVLFGSILLYSVANILNAFVVNVEQYTLLRFIAGVGLAGEIGAGITLVSEIMPKDKRGIGTTIVATVGVSGAVVAGIVGSIAKWQTAYIIGGIMGIMLLLLRVSVNESGLFSDALKKAEIKKGSLLMLVNNKERFIRYLSCILVGTPIWYAIGILVTFSPEIAVSINITEPVKVASGIFYAYIGLTIGDLASGLFSQYLKSRKKAMLFFILGAGVTSISILKFGIASAQSLYNLFLVLGFFVGYWAVFITTSAEQFGTNLRATVATSTPNFVRGAVVPMTILFEYLKNQFGILGSAQIVGILVFTIALFALMSLKETFQVDLDYIEK